jgi:hypothetical protein
LLRKNLLSVVVRGIFDSFGDVLFLDLSANMITSIELGAFGSSRIRELSLAENLLTRLHPSHFPLSTVKLYVAWPFPFSECGLLSRSLLLGLVLSLIFVLFPHPRSDISKNLFHDLCFHASFFSAHKNMLNIRIFDALNLSVCGADWVNFLLPMPSLTDVSLGSSGITRLTDAMFRGVPKLRALCAINPTQNNTYSLLLPLSHLPSQIIKYAEQRKRSNAFFY